MRNINSHNKERAAFHSAPTVWGRLRMILLVFKPTNYLGSTAQSLESRSGFEPSQPHMVGNL